MILDTWAIKHGVPFEALRELRLLMGVSDTLNEGDPSESEAAIQTRARIELSKAGGRAWRNNVGACVDDRGNFIRYGLANDSKKLNASMKSSDLIGIQPVVITPDMVGRTIGQFVALEVKAGGWSYTGTAREKAQLKFIELINSLGGSAKFVSN